MVNLWKKAERVGVGTGTQKMGKKGRGYLDKLAAKIDKHLKICEWHNWANLSEAFW